MTNLLKGYQLELNFRSTEDENKETDVPSVEKDIHRGSKSFIQQMREKNNVDLFTGASDVDEFTGEPLESEES
jgi:hypothetical protein